MACRSNVPPKFLLPVFFWSRPQTDWSRPSIGAGNSSFLHQPTQGASSMYRRAMETRSGRRK